MRIHVNATSAAQFDAAVLAVRAVVGERSITRTGLSVIEVVDAPPAVVDALSALATAAGWSHDVAPDPRAIDRNAIAAALGVPAELLREVTP